MPVGRTNRCAFIAALSGVAAGHGRSTAGAGYQNSSHRSTVCERKTKSPDCELDSRSSGDTPGIAQRWESQKRIPAIYPIMHQKAAVKRDH
jgi:hypothetical protein